MTNNKNSTRYYSDQHEKSVVKALGGRQTSNSGAGKFHKGDVVVGDTLIECKTSMTEKNSVSIKKRVDCKKQRGSICYAIIKLCSLY